MISGLFLVSEKPFSVGDVIRTGDTVGVVDSIDLLSVKIRTFDNLYIRVPNEKLANSQLTNITRYPIRRMDFTVRVNYGQEISRVQEILLDIARDNEKCLQEPAPIVLCQDYTDYGPRILFGVWFLRADYIQVKNSVFAEILQRFAREGIGIPVAPRSLQLAPGAEPFPVRVVDPFADPGPGNVDAQPDVNK